MKFLSLILITFSLSAFSADSDGYFFDTVVRLLEENYDMVCSKRSGKKYHCHPSVSTKIGFEVSLDKTFFLFRWINGGKYSIKFETFNNSDMELMKLDPAKDQDDFHENYPKTEKFYGRQLSLDFIKVVSDIKRADCNPLERQLKGYSGVGDNSFKVKKYKKKPMQESKCFESDGNVINVQAVYENGIIRRIVIKE